MLYQHTSTLFQAGIEVNRFLERVESLDSIVATFRLPSPLRRFVFTEAVGRGGLEPSTSAVLGLERSTNECARSLESIGVIGLDTVRSEPDRGPTQCGTSPALNLTKPALAHAAA